MGEQSLLAYALPPLVQLRFGARCGSRPLRDGRRRYPACCAVARPSDDADETHLLRCVEIAWRAAGQTRPNPPVGCVLTDARGERLGEGYHRCAGQPHAEVNALADARRNGHAARVRGATVYVSLEPCNHFGRTPPCAKTLVEAGVSRVVVGMLDPDPRTAGGGVKTLRDAGIQVRVGVSSEQCSELVEGFVWRTVRKRPFGVLKWAMTLDGKIATESRSSKWITGADSRYRVHQLRNVVDAIIVGGNTVREDDPQLTVRGVSRDGDLAPKRIVITKSLDLPPERQLWDTTQAETHIFTATLDGHDDFVQLLASRGVTVHHVPGLSIDDVMAALYDLGCLSVLWECGGALASQAIAVGAVQKVHAFVAPKLVGGAHAATPLAAPALADDMNDALVLTRRKVETFNNGDLLITGYLE